MTNKVYDYTYNVNQNRGRPASADKRSRILASPSKTLTLTVPPSDRKVFFTKFEEKIYSPKKSGEKSPTRLAWERDMQSNIFNLELKQKVTAKCGESTYQENFKKSEKDK